MAHVEHFKRHDVPNLLNEWNRERDGTGKWKFTRTGAIDEARTADNYTMEPDGDPGSMKAKLRARLAEVEAAKRKDLNVVSDWVVTCPKELAGREKEFFRLTYDFMRSRYGTENILNGYVHMDETTPHMHVPMVPVIGGRVSAKVLFTRRELSGFHTALDAEVGRVFGVRGLVRNGRTKGNYTVAELRERTKDQEELTRRKADLEAQEAALKARQRVLDAREAQIRQDGQRAAERLAEAEEAISEAEAVKVKALEVLDRCDRWLDGRAEDSGIIDYAKRVTNKAGVSMWDRYQAQAKPTRDTLAQARQMVDGLTVPSIEDQIAAQRQRAGMVRPARKQLTQREASAGLEL